ncbi:MAG: hypothetical protein JNN15_21600 [Blastocatellia bacterium]|nr:hypothetical protein [Blastocatellia bacterium]
MRLLSRSRYFKIDSFYDYDARAINLLQAEGLSVSASGGSALAELLKGEPSQQRIPWILGVLFQR